MTDRIIGLEKDEEVLFSYEVSDVVLESAGGNETAGHYFVRSDTFITFPEESGIEALEPGQAHLLTGVIERIIGIEGPPLSDGEVKTQLTSKGRTEEVVKFDQILSGITCADLIGWCLHGQVSTPAIVDGKRKDFVSLNK